MATRVLGSRPRIARPPAGRWLMAEGNRYCTSSLHGVVRAKGGGRNRPQRLADLRPTPQPGAWSQRSRTRLRGRGVVLFRHQPEVRTRPRREPGGDPRGTRMRSISVSARTARPRSNPPSSVTDGQRNSRSSIHGDVELLNLDVSPAERDTADAMAVALTHIHMLRWTKMSGSHRRLHQTHLTRQNPFHVDKSSLTTHGARATMPCLHFE